MPEFFALVDALPGMESAVGDALRRLPGLRGVEPCRAGNFDYLVRFDAASFSVVDDFLQTHVRSLSGVKGVEIITDWEDQPAVAREARDRMLHPRAALTSVASAPSAPAPRAPPKAVVLLSGGLDSTVAAAMAKAEGFEVHALSFDYGQRHKRELDSARDVARALGVASHTVMNVPIASYGASALTDASIAVPTSRNESTMAKEIPVTYVPARNIVFLSLALGLAEAREAGAIFIGANALDYSGYPDCRPEFFAAFEAMAKVGTKRGVEGKPLHVRVPLQSMKKADIVREGLRLRAPLDLTWSCYQGGQVACGVCDSCLLRLKGFKEAGVKDLVPYAR